MDFRTMHKGQGKRRVVAGDQLSGAPVAQSYHTLTNNAVFPVTDADQPEVRHYHTKHQRERLPNLMPTLRNNSGRIDSREQQYQRQSPPRKAPSPVDEHHISMKELAFR